MATSLRKKWKSQRLRKRDICTERKILHDESESGSESELM